MDIIGYYSKTLQNNNNNLTTVQNDQNSSLLSNLISPSKPRNNEEEQIENPNKIDTKENRELLQKLFKQAFEPKLSLLEKNSKKISSAIKDTLTVTNYITNLAIRMNKQVKEKLEQKRKEALAKMNKNKKNMLSPKGSGGCYTKPRIGLGHSRFGSKAVLDNEKKDSQRSKSNMTLVRSRKMTLEKSKSLSNLNSGKKKLEKSRSVSTLRREKNKDNSFTRRRSNSRTANNNSEIISGDEDLRRPSLISSKSEKNSKTNLTTYNTKLNSKSNNRNNPLLSSGKPNDRHSRIMKNNLSKSKEKNSSRKKTPLRSKMFPIDNSLNDTGDDNYLKTSPNRKKYKHKIGSKTFDSNLDRDELYINNDDPLLVLPTNAEQEPIFGESPNLKLNHFDLSKNINEDIISNISKYLSPIDIIPLKNVSKAFHNYSISHLIKFFEQEINNFIKYQKDLQLKEPPPKINLNNLSLTKGAERAIELLNDSLLNRLFNDEVVSNVDILLVYRIFFRLINHPYALINKQEEFWEKCRHYFLQETKGKTGDFINSIITNNELDLSGNNLYKLYTLVIKNLNKILPAYFCQICGTTGLFAFYVKDVLDFLGISNEKKIKKRAYWTYDRIILGIKENEEYLQKRLIKNENNDID